MSRRSVRALMPSRADRSRPLKRRPVCKVASSSSIRPVVSDIPLIFHQLRSGSGRIWSYRRSVTRSATAPERAIRIRAARTNNLRDLDIDIPRGQLVVFAGVSGSGKSSLVFDTIAAEAGYQLNETYPPFVRNRLPRWSRPDVDAIDGLSPV